MEAVCARGDRSCEAHALAAALHALHLYCASISAALICCCCKTRPRQCNGTRWRGQNVRGTASVVLGALWACGAAAGALRPAGPARLVAALLAPLAWLAASALHVVLWTRRAAAPLLYLAIYWLLAAASSATILFDVADELSWNTVVLYVHSLTMTLALIMSAVDCVCFYDKVTKRFHNQQKSTATECPRIAYKHNESHYYSKITFFWLNTFLYRGYESPLEQEDLGELPEEEHLKNYLKLKRLYNEQQVTKTKERGRSLLQCYLSFIWPNFYIAGILKLFGDLIGVIPPMGLAIIIQFIEEPTTAHDASTEVTTEEYLKSGHVMLLIVTLALILQALLSQNSTHLVTVEGIRLKTSLQSMVYDKCMRLASWSSTDAEANEESPLLNTPENTNNTQSGLLANLISQDTYNIMSCVWICHYTWAIPLKVAVILYLLYTKLGVSAIIGTTITILFITPLQFYIGKKISDNSKDVSKCTDHRVSKMAEILQGINVIKLYVWEDLFNEKILQLREVELKLLNKDSMYWGILTLMTQASSVFVTVITFTIYYFLNDNQGLTAVNVFAGLALFNQLTIPLLILPVTVQMVIQAMVSTNRINEFLELPESNNAYEDNHDHGHDCHESNREKFNDDFVDISPNDNPLAEKDETVLDFTAQVSDEENGTFIQGQEYLIRFRNAAFSWRMRHNIWLEIDDLDIPAGKIIMVVGCTGSGKSSFLSAILGEMYLERGDVNVNGNCAMWYDGQPSWLLELSIRDNILMGSPWCHRRYQRVLRATGLQPDLQLLPDGDHTQLGSSGAPLSGGQRVRVCVARALYSRASLLALDEPLAALDAPLARHLVARALLPAARSGRAVLVATNRLELLHYSDLVIVMEDGRVSGFGRASAMEEGVLGQWARLAGEARAAAARAGAGPPGGVARERSLLLRALSRGGYHADADNTLIGINEAAGSHLLAEVGTRAGGSWRRARRPRPALSGLSRQLSSPPPAMHHNKYVNALHK